ncbi:MAG: gliding motility-associated C-terminal domain-containing protein [Bacteroidales bacterium]|nr:gliding motility-associated C-terminal domain-containing protein [Bacteroidales bacterium]
MKGGFWMWLTMLWTCMAVSAQTIPAPEIEAVSVDPSTGEVTISWKFDSTVPVDGFIVLWLNPQDGNTTNYGIDTLVNSAVRSYRFQPETLHLSPEMPNPRYQTVPFTVAAFRNSPWTAGLRSQEHYNVCLALQFDSCKSELHFNWRPYKGWDANLKQYRVMEAHTTSAPTLVATVQDTSFTFSNMPVNQSFTYFVEAERNDGLLASSFQKSVYTRTPVPPAFIAANELHYNDNMSEIMFSLDIASQTHDYVLLGSNYPNTDFISIDTFVNITENAIITADVKSRNKTYYYRLAALHFCGTGYTTVSKTMTALWLAIAHNEQMNDLSWDTFVGWDSVEYQIYRTIAQQERRIATLSDGETAYHDDVAGLPTNGDICYHIVAVPANVAGYTRQSVSNTVCLQPESDIFIPDAFTPNGDGMNDIYRPSFSYAPQEFLMFIFDRNGAKVFETKTPSDGWDGRLRNGKPANEGVYGFYVRYKTAKGVTFENKGTITLIKP